MVSFYIAFGKNVKKGSGNGIMCPYTLMAVGVGDEFVAKTLPVPLNAV